MNKIIYNKKFVFTIVKILKCNYSIYYMFGRILKRFCHHRDKCITQLPNASNPLVECEKTYNKRDLENNKPPGITETSIFIENGTFIHSQSKYLPIQIQYVDNNNKIHKILVHLTK